MILFRNFFLAAVVIAICLVSGRIEAGQEFRGFQAFPSPAADAQKNEDLESEGFQRITAAQNLPLPLVEKVVYDLFGAWNSPNLGSKLSKDFPNKSRIVDAIQTGVPRHVRLQVLSFQNPRIVEQYFRPHPDGDGTYQVISKISVRVTSQVAASSGLSKNFVRAEGTSDYLISVKQKVRGS